MKILAVDDEQRGLNVLTRSIQNAVPEAILSCFQNPFDALEYAKHNPVDIAFLDVKMPGLDGLALAVQLKAFYPKINLIFITGYQEYAGDAFALHASGYVHKPVSPSAVQEQMENLRFALPNATQQTLKFGPYTIDHLTQRVYYNKQDTLLKPREFQLFCLFADNVGKYFTPEQLYQAIWGNDPNGNVHTVYVRVSDLRKKLGMDKDNIYTIEQKRGKGYRFIHNDI